MSKNFYGIQVLLVEKNDTQRWRDVGTGLGDPLIFETMEEARQFLERIWPLIDGKDIRIIKTDSFGNLVEEDPLE